MNNNGETVAMLFAYYGNKYISECWLHDPGLMDKTGKTYIDTLKKNIGEIRMVYKNILC